MSNNYYYRAGGGGGAPSNNNYNNNRGGGGNYNNGNNYARGGQQQQQQGYGGGNSNNNNSFSRGGNNNSGGGGYNNNNNGGGGYNGNNQQQRGGGGYSQQPPNNNNNTSYTRPPVTRANYERPPPPPPQLNRSNSNMNQSFNNNGGGGGIYGGNNYNQQRGGYSQQPPNNNNNNQYERRAGGGGYDNKSDRRPQYAPSVPSSNNNSYQQQQSVGGYNNNGNGGGMMGQRINSSGPSGLEKITCSKHNKQRLRKFCTEQPVYNADGEVLRMSFACRDEDPCTTRDSFRTDGDAAATADGEDAGTTLFGVKITSVAVAADKKPEVVDVDAAEEPSSPRSVSSATLQQQKPAQVLSPTATSSFNGLPDSAANGQNASRAMLEGSASLGLFGGSPSPINSPTSTTITTGPQFRNAPVVNNRYYDMSGNVGGMGAVEERVENKKVCWQCGMSTHEKPNCKNTLCFTCHTHQEPGYHGKMNHRCQEVPPSSFVALDLPLTGTFLTAEEVKAHNATNNESFVDYLQEVSRLRSESDAVVRERLEAVTKSSTSTDVTVDSIMADPATKQFFMEPTDEERVLMSFGYMYHIPTEDDAAASLYHTADGANKEAPAAVSANLLSTQCLRCHRFGHMDCKIEPEWSTPTTGRSGSRLNCCYCLAVGHSGLNCSSRRRDIWRERAVQASIGIVGRNNVVTSPDDAQALGLVAPNSRTGGATSAFAALQNQNNRNNNRGREINVLDDDEDVFSSKLSRNHSGSGSAPTYGSSSSAPSRTVTTTRRQSSYSDSSSSSSFSSSYSDSEDEYDPSNKKTNKKKKLSAREQKQLSNIRSRSNNNPRSSPPTRSGGNYNNNNIGEKRGRSGDYDSRAPQQGGGGRRQEAAPPRHQPNNQAPPQQRSGSMNNRGQNNNYNNNRRGGGGHFEF